MTKDTGDLKLSVIADDFFALTRINGLQQLTYKVFRKFGFLTEGTRFIERCAWKNLFERIRQIEWFATWATEWTLSFFFY